MATRKPKSDRPKLSAVPRREPESLDELIRDERAKTAGPSKDGVGPLPDLGMGGEPPKAPKVPFPAELKEALRVAIRSINPRHTISTEDQAKAADALEAAAVHWAEVEFPGMTNPKTQARVGLGVAIGAVAITEVRALRGAARAEALRQHEAAQAKARAEGGAEPVTEVVHVSGKAGNA